MSTTKKKPAAVPLAVALREAHDWCESAIFQGARLMELLENQVAFDHANAMAAEWRALRAANHLPSGARVEVVESYFFLTSIRHVLAWLGHLTRHKNRPTKETVLAAKEFAAAVPRAADLRRVLDHEYTIGGWDLPELNLQTPGGGMALMAARGREYRMAAGVSLQGAMAALRKLAPVLAGARPKPQ
jgi:hypothetical protein